MTDPVNDELICFSEPEQADGGGERAHWQVLLVDDEPDVHAATLLALKGLEIEGRPLAFTQAHSSAEAQAILHGRHDFAVAIVDVVMEREDSGLQLVRHIREVLNHSALRIILRTGQPGYAPEIETIQKYDINDYKTKAELTRVRLFTSVTIAIRSYAQIQQLHTGRRGLEQVLAGMRELGKPAGLKKFAAGIVTQLCALLEVEEECLVCAAMEAPDATPFVLAAAGHYTPCVGLPLESIPQAHVRQQLAATLHQRHASFEHGASLYFPGDQQQALAAYVDVARPLDAVERGLLDVFCSNISVAFENLQLHTTISRLAFTDDMLALPNRNGLAQALEQPVQEPHALALVDIDSFADINSLLDDSFGDKVLRGVAERLRAAFSSAVCVARVGSDVFGLYGPATELTPQAVATLFAQPFAMLDSTPLRLSATSGWVQVAAVHAPPAELYKNAGAALKQGKHFRRGQALFYREEQACDARDRMQLLNELRSTFSRQGLYLHYQPFVHLHSGAVVGAEALLRWRKEDGSSVPPDRFIAMAEQSGLIIPIGNWVLRSAMRWRAALGTSVAPGFRIAINISQAQFREPDFVDTVLAITAECALPASAVELELTESVAADNVADTAAKIQALRQHGYGVAMDDFGTGFSSLSVLQQLPVDRLKIDRSFVSGVSAQASGMAVAYTILTLAEQLGIHTIAEGIETAEQRQQLAAAGCEEGQGYLFSRPLDEPGFAELLRRGTL